MTAAPPLEHRRLSLATGVELDVTTGGPEDAPAVIFLHGFPESSRTWRGVLPAVAERYRVVAPDQRGYARSSKPEGVEAYTPTITSGVYASTPSGFDEGVEAYTPDVIVGDLIALADALGIARFTLVGHDWGGAIAWMAALRHPDRIERLTIVNAPHPYVFQRSLYDSDAQRRASQYITRFRDTGIDRGLVGEGLQRFLGSTFAHHITHALLGEDKAAYLDEWSQPGAMTAMLNWYRASPVVVPEPGATPPRPAFLDAPFPPVTQPTLVVWGMRDVALLPVQLEGLEALVPDLRIVRVPDAGHFVTWEKPEAVVAPLLAFLGER